MCGTRALVVGAAHQQQEHALEDDLAGGHGEGSRIPRSHLALISAVSQLHLSSASQLLPLGPLSAVSRPSLRLEIDEEVDGVLQVVVLPHLVPGRRAASPCVGQPPVERR